MKKIIIGVFLSLFLIVCAEKLKKKKILWLLHKLTKKQG